MYSPFVAIVSHRVHGGELMFAVAVRGSAFRLRRIKSVRLYSGLL